MKASLLTQSSEDEIDTAVAIKSDQLGPVIVQIIESAMRRSRTVIMSLAVIGHCRRCHLRERAEGGRA